MISRLDSWISQADLILQSSLFYSFLQIETAIGALTTALFISISFMRSLLPAEGKGPNVFNLYTYFQPNLCGDIPSIFEPEQKLGFVAAMQASLKLLREYKLGRIFCGERYTDEMLRASRLTVGRVGCFPT